MMTRPQSSIQLESHQDTNRTQLSIDIPRNENNLSHPSGISASRSLHDIPESFSHQDTEHGLHQQGAPVQVPEPQHPHMHVYESLHPLPNPPRGISEQYADITSAREPIHSQSRYSRQASAPSAVSRQRQVSLPNGAYAHPGNASGNDSSVSQSALESSLHGNPQAVPPAAFSQVPSGAQELQQQQQQSANPQPYRMHRSLSENFHTHPQSQAVDALALKPQPKPRNISISSSPAGQLVPVQPQALPITPSILSVDVLHQHNNEQLAANQFLATYQGQTQLQTYSYAHQSSVITIPGTSSIQTNNSPTILSIPTTFSPSQMSIQLVPPKEQNSEDKRKTVPVITDKDPSEPTAVAAKEISNTETHSQHASNENAQSDLSKRPIPKPRKTKKQVFEADGITLIESSVEVSGDGVAQDSTRFQNGSLHQEQVAEISGK